MEWLQFPRRLRSGPGGYDLCQQGCQVHLLIVICGQSVDVGRRSAVGPTATSDSFLGDLSLGGCDSYWRRPSLFYTLKNALHNSNGLQEGIQAKDLRFEQIDN